MTVMTATPPVGAISLEHVIPPKEYLGLELKKGQVMRIVDMEGKQVPDVVCFNLHDASEKLSCNNSRLIQKRWIFTTGHVLYSDEGNIMLTIVGDTVGIHHASGGCCNEPANFRRYGVPGTRNCRENSDARRRPLGHHAKGYPGRVLSVHEGHSISGRPLRDRGADLQARRLHRSSRRRRCVRRDLELSARQEPVQRLQSNAVEDRGLQSFIRRRVRARRPPCVSPS